MPGTSEAAFGRVLIPAHRGTTQIAELMNENFINIKVDREERPDIDRIYMV
jgi:uncharacterized protein YyaL (SSP411 family)